MKCPKHLRSETRKWWRVIVEGYVLEGHHLRMLQIACEAWDAGQAARELLALEGTVTTDRFGQRRAHPAVAIVKDSAATFLKAMRELSLDADAPSEPYSRGPGAPAAGKRK